MNSMIVLLNKIILTPIKSIFKVFGFNKLLCRYLDKHTIERSFQMNWLREFKNNQDKVLEYWKDIAI